MLNTKQKITSTRVLAKIFRRADSEGNLAVLGKSENAFAQRTRSSTGAQDVPLGARAPHPSPVVLAPAGVHGACAPAAVHSDALRKGDS